MINNRQKPLYLGVDFDDVLRLFAEPLQDRYNTKYGTTYSIEQHTTYRFEDVWGVEPPQVIEEIDEYCFDPSHFSVEPLEFAKDSLTRLKTVGHKLSVVTARPPEVADPTEEWLDKYLPDIFSEVVFCSHYAREGQVLSKETVVGDAGMDLLVDDNPSHVKAIQGIGRTAILFGDYPWNLEDYHRESILLTAENWLDVEQLIADISLGE